MNQHQKIDSKELESRRIAYEKLKGEIIWNRQQERSTEKLINTASGIGLPSWMK